MRLPALPAQSQHAVAAALLSTVLTIAPPATADIGLGAHTSFLLAGAVGQDVEIAAGAGKGAETKENSKIQGGGASTLQSGRRITITRGVNLDNTNW